MEIAIDQTRGRVPAIVGALSPSTPEVCAMARRAGRAGADAVMVLPPYYVTPSAAAVETHYRRVADEAGLPIVVYNNPARTHVSLDAAMLLKLAEINEVIAVKECDRDFTSLLDKIQKVGGRIRILSGEDDLAFPTLMLGAKGGIWATSNLFPEIFVSMYQAVAAGHLERARRFHHQLLPLWKAVLVPNHPAPLKEAMALASRPVGKARSPLASTEEQVANVRSALEAVSLYGH